MDKENKHWWLYVLKLEQGKYYVGITSLTPEKRMQQHIHNFIGARWTQKHKPIELFYKKDLGVTTLEKAQEYENKVTRKYMKEYGFNNVRGGDLSFSGSFVKRFGWYIDENSWEAITVVVLLLAIIAYLSIELYFK